ncbi:MAG: hypothetical protein JNK94_02845 [Hyphomonadaceae bacterium]|nr:hypothetical protein [Hyphomonadaceae bacterium]
MHWRMHERLNLAPWRRTVDNSVRAQGTCRGAAKWGRKQRRITLNVQSQTAKQDASSQPNDNDNGAGEQEITTTPLTTHDAAPEGLAAAPLRRRRRAFEPRQPSLALSRVKRALRRQAGPFFLAVLVIVAIGCGFEMLSGAPVELALPLWLAIGAGAALVVTLFRELNRNTIVSLSSLGQHRGYAVLGAAPELNAAALRQLPPDARTPLGCVTWQPASAFAASFRDLQAAVAPDGVVAFIAPGVNEGATTAALCTAASAMQQGRRVIVIDCDVRRRSLTRALGRDPSAGVMEAAQQPDAWRSFVDHEDETGLPFIAAAAPASPWQTLYGAPGFEALINKVRAEYDLVVLDCPPALGNAEGGLIARLAHRCVVVTVWDDTPLSAVRAAMRMLRTRSRVTTALYVNRVPAGFRFGRLRPE